MLKTALRNAFDNSQTRLFWFINDSLAIITLVSVVLVMLETSEVLATRYAGLFTALEYIITAIFTVEYFIHIYLAEKKRTYLTSFYGFIDLIAILPTYLLLANLQFLKVVRVVRLLRLLRMLRLLKMMRIVRRRYQRSEASRQILRINLTIYVVAYLLFAIIFSVLLFEVERDVPGSQIQTLPDAVWSVTASLSSVGFGDIFPSSFLGRLLLSLVMLVGVGFLSFAVLTLGKFFQHMLYGESIEDDLDEVMNGELTATKERSHQSRPFQPS